MTAFHSLEGSPCVSDRNRRDSFLSAYESLGGLESNGDRGSKKARSSQASKKISLVPGNLLGPGAASADAAGMKSSSSSSSAQKIDLPTAGTISVADTGPNDELMDVDTDAAKEKQEVKADAEGKQIPSTAFPPPGPTAAHPLASPPDAGEKDKTAQVEDVFDIVLDTPLEDAPMAPFEERQVLQKAAQGVLSSTEEAGAGVAETGGTVAGASGAAAELADAANNSEGVVRPEQVHEKNPTTLEEQVGPTAKPALQQDQLVVLEPAPHTSVKDVSLVHPPVVPSGGKEGTNEEKIVGDVEMQVADVEVEQDQSVGEELQEAEDDPDAMEVDFSQDKPIPSQEAAKEGTIAAKGIDDQVENKLAAAHQLLSAPSGTAVVDAPLLQPPAADQPEQSILPLEKNNKRDAMEQCGANIEGAKDLKKAKTGAGGTTVSMKKSGTTKSSASSKKAPTADEEPEERDVNHTTGVSLDQQDNIEQDQGPAKPAPKMKVAPAMKKAASAGGGKSKTGTKGAVEAEDFEQELIEDNKEPPGATTAMKSSSSKAMKQTAATPAANNKSSGASSSTTSMKQEGAAKAMKAPAAAMKQQPAAKSSGAKKVNGGSSSSATGAQSSFIRCKYGWLWKFVMLFGESCGRLDAFIDSQA